MAASGGAAAPGSAAPAATRFTVHGPLEEARPAQKRSLAAPAPRTAQPARQKVDKNALSARGQPAGVEDATMWKVVTGRRSGRSSPTSLADDASPRKSPRGSSVASEAECSETEDTEQTTDASPRRSLRLAHSESAESAASPEEGVVARARQLAEVGWTAADTLKGYRKVDGKVVKMVHRADTPERRRMSDDLVRHA